LCSMRDDFIGAAGSLRCGTFWGFPVMRVILRRHDAVVHGTKVTLLVQIYGFLGQKGTGTRQLFTMLIPFDGSPKKSTVLTNSLKPIARFIRLFGKTPRSELWADLS